MYFMRMAHMPVAGMARQAETSNVGNPYVYYDEAQEQYVMYYSGSSIWLPDTKNDEPRFIGRATAQHLEGWVGGWVYEFVCCILPSLLLPSLLAFGILFALDGTGEVCLLFSMHSFVKSICLGLLLAAYPNRQPVSQPANPRCFPSVCTPSVRQSRINVFCHSIDTKAVEEAP